MAAYLVRTPHPMPGTVEEEEEEEEGLWVESGHTCSACNENIHLTEEIYMLKVVVPSITDKIQYSDIVAEDGDFLYEPLFFCYNCWEELIETIKEWVEDSPPVDDAHSIFNCSICNSGIRQGEVMSVSAFGEMHITRRSPDGITGTRTFEICDDDPTKVCIHCLRMIDEDSVDLWNGGVSQLNECREGTAVRCWRYGCPVQGYQCSFDFECEVKKEANQ